MCMRHKGRIHTEERTENIKTEKTGETQERARTGPEHQPIAEQYWTATTGKSVTIQNIWGPIGRRKKERGQRMNGEEDEEGE